MSDDAGGRPQAAASSPEPAIAAPKAARTAEPAEPAGAAPAIDRGRSAALTAIGQVFVLLGASLIGLVVAASLAPGARLDAYFNANQLTIAALYVGQALRTSVPGLSVGGVVRIPVLARAAAVMTGIVAVVLLLGVVLGPYLLPDASRAAMRSDLLVLLPGAVLQVGAGYAAGRLAMAGRFAGAALSYAAGTVVNGLLLVALIGGRGAEVLAPTALAGWITSATIVGVLLLRERGRGTLATPVTTATTAEPAAVVAAAPAGPATQPFAAGAPAETVAAATTTSPHEPHEPHAAATSPVEPVGVLGAVGRITLSVTPVLAAQLLIFAAGVAAAHLREGGSTIVSYAFLAMNAVGTVAVAPIPIVLSADLGTTWDRRAESLLELMYSVVRLSVGVIMPLVLGLFLVGQPVADRFLGGLSPADVDDLFTVALVLLASLPITAASMVALVAVFALDRLPTVAKLVVAAGVAAAASLALVVVLDGSLLVLAFVASGWAAVLGAATITPALGVRTPAAIVAIYRQTVLVGGPAALVLAAALLSGTAESLAPGVAWAVAGALVHLGWLRLRYPAELAVLTRVVRR